MSSDQYLALREGVDVDEVSLGFRTVNLLPPGELEAAQAGYEGADWSPSWLVIAQEDELGDPIFTDTASDRLPVFTAAHGEGEWNPVQIADSFQGFVTGLEAVASVSTGREHPVGLEANPLSEAERGEVLEAVRTQNPGSDSEFWESWLVA